MWPCPAVGWLAARAPELCRASSQLPRLVRGLAAAASRRGRSQAFLRRGRSRLLAALEAAASEVQAHLRCGRPQRLWLELRCSWLQQLPLELPARLLSALGVVVLLRHGRSQLLRLEAAVSEVEAHLRCGWSQRLRLELRCSRLQQLPRGRSQRLRLELPGGLPGGLLVAEGHYEGLEACRPGTNREPGRGLFRYPPHHFSSRSSRGGTSLGPSSAR